jgi:hypothetical protein
VKSGERNQQQWQYGVGESENQAWRGAVGGRQKRSGGEIEKMKMKAKESIEMAASAWRQPTAWRNIKACNNRNVSWRGNKESISEIRKRRQSNGENGEIMKEIESGNESGVGAMAIMYGENAAASGVASMAAWPVALINVEESINESVSKWRK